MNLSLLHFLDGEHSNADLEYMRNFEGLQNFSSKTRKRRTYINRDFESAYNLLFRDYFSDTPTFDSEKFERRFRMSKELYLKIVEAIVQTQPLFSHHVDGIGKKGLHPLVKITAVWRCLCYGSAYDSVDEYLKIGESTVMIYLDLFIEAMLELFQGRILVFID